MTNEKHRLNVSKIIAYLNGWDDAPSAQEVFDHYWSVLEYALSDEEKLEILALSTENAVDALFELGGEVWNAAPDIDLLSHYEYFKEDAGVEGTVGDFSFVYPKRPIDNLRAGIAIGKNMSTNVVGQFYCYDSYFVRSVHVYYKDELLDILNVSPCHHAIYKSVGERPLPCSLNKELNEAEEDWAKFRHLKWEPRKMGNLKFTDFFFEKSIRDELYTVKGIVQSEMNGDLGNFDNNLEGNELKENITKTVDGTILGYLIKIRGEEEVWEYLRTLDYPYATQWATRAPDERIFPSRRICSEVIEEVPDVIDTINRLPVKEAANQLEILSRSEFYRKSNHVFPLEAPLFKYGESMLELPFSYSQAELTLQGVWEGVRFELPKTPKQLLLLGAQTGQCVSLFAWDLWRKYKSAILLFNEANDEYIGYVSYWAKTMHFSFDCLPDLIDWDSINKNYSPFGDLFDVLQEWINDSRTEISWR